MAALVRRVASRSTRQARRALRRLQPASRLRQAPSIRARPARRAARRRDIRRLRRRSAGSSTTARIWCPRPSRPRRRRRERRAGVNAPAGASSLVAIAFEVMQTSARSMIEQRVEDVRVRHIDQRRGLQRRADVLGGAFEFERTGDDAADVADGFPLRGERVVAEFVKPFREQRQMHRRLGVRPVHPPRLFGGEAQHRRQPVQDRIADDVDRGQRRLARRPRTADRNTACPCGCRNRTPTIRCS